MAEIIFGKEDAHKAPISSYASKKKKKENSKDEENNIIN